MPLTPAQRYRQRTIAAQRAASEPMASLRAQASQYELMLLQLAGHRRQMKGLQSIEARNLIKARLVHEYDAYIDGVLAGGRGQQDDVIMTLMVWRVDTGDIPGALDIAEYALRHGLTTPDQYTRSTGCLIAEEVADAALATAAFERIPVSLGDLQTTERITRGSDMPDQVRAKLHKAIGLAFGRAGLPREAITHLHRALELNERCGVKKDIERLEREARRQAGP